MKHSRTVTRLETEIARHLDSMDGEQEMANERELSIETQVHLAKMRTALELLRER